MILLEIESISKYIPGYSNQLTLEVFRIYTKPVWEMILETVDAQKLEAITNSDIHRYILDHYGDVNVGTIDAQIGACCVNRQSRVNMPENKKTRIANGCYDILYGLDRGVFTKYIPEKHGTWAIVEIDGNLVVKRIDKKGQELPSMIPAKKKTCKQERVNRPDIERPSVDVVHTYLAKWKTLENYKPQEDALNKLYRDLCPGNEQLDDVLLKASVLNNFYSTNVFNITALSKHIHNLGIDERLKQGDLSLVTDIATGHGISNTSTGKEIYFYSFATKYCSHHCPLVYPIFDSYVEDMLVYLKNVDGFADFTRGQLRDITTFHSVILAMRSYYSLEEYSLKEIDQYLWQCGKESLPKKF